MAAIRLRQLAAIVTLAALALPALAALPVGKAAPPLVVTTLGGGTFDLGALHGKTVIVHLWATWCVSCREEMPALDAFYREHRDQGLELICVSLDRRRDLREVEKVAQPFAYPVALWSGAKVNGFSQPEALPLTYVIDDEGVVRAVLRPGKGPLTTESLGAVVLPLLEGRTRTKAQ